MKVIIVDVLEPVTLIGGGESNPEDIKYARRLAPVCVAADGGADAALSAGVDLTAVIGDMDSISDAARAQIPLARLHRIAEQDSTDFDKALRSIAAPLILAVGFSGGRIDHQLAALHTLAVRSDKLVVLIGQEDIVFLCPPSFSLPLASGTRVSLFPMGPVSGRSQGLNWPIEGLRFAPGVLTGTSNHAVGDLHLEMDAPQMLCILPRDLIQPAVSALLAVPRTARWTAHAAQRKDLPQS